MCSDAPTTVTVEYKIQHTIHTGQLNAVCQNDNQGFASLEISNVKLAFGGAVDVAIGDGTNWGGCCSL